MLISIPIDREFMKTGSLYAEYHTFNGLIKDESLLGVDNCS